jgi:hypothetical protein
MPKSRDKTKFHNDIEDLGNEIDTPGLTNT